MSQEERDRETAQKVVNIFLRKMNVTVNETVTENLLEQFKEDFIKKLVERKPLAFLCDHAPDALFFQGLRGLKELAPFFSFKLSMIIFWKTGSICVNYFNGFPRTSLKKVSNSMRLSEQVTSKTKILNTIILCSSSKLLLMRSQRSRC